MSAWLGRNPARLEQQDKCKAERSIYCDDNPEVARGFSANNAVARRTRLRVDATINDGVADVDGENNSDDFEHDRLVATRRVGARGLTD